MSLALQPRIKKGDLKAIEVGVLILSHKARIIGYYQPSEHVKVQEREKKDGDKKPVYNKRTLRLSQCLKRRLRRLQGYHDNGDRSS
jgi:hypothetical protein